MKINAQMIDLFDGYSSEAIIDRQKFQMQTKSNDLAASSANAKRMAIRRIRAKGFQLIFLRSMSQQQLTDPVVISEPSARCFVV
ncbi:MAG: hypothetical protein AB3X44_11520 [Leptothrix sp. (in: b-proteobacteria)]